MPRAPAVAVEPGADDQPLVERDARLGQAPAIAGESLARDVQRGRTGQERDLPMAEPDELGDHRRDAADVVDADLRLARGVRREVDDGRAVAAHRGDVLAHLRVDHRVVQPAAREDERGRAHRAQQADVRVLALGVAIGAAGDDQVAAGRGRVLDAPDDLREVRVGDVVDDHPDDRDGALEQPAGEGVRDVVEGPGRLEDAGARRGADRVWRGRDHARHGRGRDPGEPGDVGDRCHARRPDQNGKVGWLVAHRHPLPLGERVEAGLAAVPAAVAGVAHPAERDDRLVVERPVVDVDHAGPHPVRERQARARSSACRSRRPGRSCWRWPGRSPPRRSRRR